MSASVSMTFEELPLVTALGKVSFQLMSVHAVIVYRSPMNWRVTDIRSDAYPVGSTKQDGWEELDRTTPLWLLIVTAIEETQAAHVENAIREDIANYRREAA